MTYNTQAHHDTDRDDAATKIFQRGFGQGAPQLGNNAAKHLEVFLEDDYNLQLLAMGVFRSMATLEALDRHELDKALSLFDGEDSNIGGAVARIQQFMESAQRYAPRRTTLPVSTSAVYFGRDTKQSDFGLAL